MFLGYKDKEDYLKSAKWEVKIEDIVELRQVKKNGRRCECCKTLVKFDSEGNKTWFYYVDPDTMIVPEFMAIHSSVFCCMDCVKEGLSEFVEMPIEKYLIEATKKLIEHNNEMVRLIEEHK